MSTKLQTKLREKSSPLADIEAAPNTNKAQIISSLAEEYNKECYFLGDPIIFPKHFALLMNNRNTPFCNRAGEDSSSETFPEKVCGAGSCIVSGYKPQLKDVEIAGLIAAHLAWGRREMIIRDCIRAFNEMKWQPLQYIMKGKYRDDDKSLHRTIKWSEFAGICKNMRDFYSNNESVEILPPDQIRVLIYGQESNPKMANKKIHMFRRWMTRDDNIVDLGLWKNTSPADLIIPLDTHVHNSALKLGITKRKSTDFTTAKEITDYLKSLFPCDPCIGDFALFAYAATQREIGEKKNKEKKKKEKE